MRSNIQSSLAKRLRVGLFLAALFLPFGGLVLNWNTTVSLEEKRDLAPLPEVPSGLAELAELPRGMEKFISDHFGFRQELSSLYNLIQLRVLAPKPSRWVVSGDDDWLYMGQSVSYARKNAPLSAKRLEAWATLLRAKRDWLTRRGVRYVFTVAPSKPSIYSSQIPQDLAPAPVSALDQLNGVLTGQSDIPWIDLKSMLLEQVATRQVYHKTDTHWNDTGAALAASAVLRRAAMPGVTPPGLDDFRRRSVSGIGLDLAKMLGLQYMLTEDYEVLSPLGSSPVAIRDRTYLGRDWGPYPARLFSTAGRSGRVAIVGDSFVMATTFTDRIAEQFATGVGVHRDKLSPDSPQDLELLIKAVQPDLIVEELVERNLIRFAPDPKPFLEALAVQ
ncbi:alginate O-acetyltransferase AlgX-related protein [Desulfovibrio ferrophilus]|uniref:Alginate O-acetyltransferase n=1 Tax=Desulfovibrio ferrophilus TaxID=241368 RepID=A0A2Z6B1T2_9BACT|nr:hypothetical protein [Desulfovibrio ferrophilus]BBD09356.1 alginate O-acetyltransferase [Desulfovibrio ferrophilus]